MLSTDWCAFRLVHSHDDPSSVISKCLHITSQEGITEQQCKELACSLKANWINYWLERGKCHAKRCSDGDLKLK